MKARKIFLAPLMAGALFLPPVAARTRRQAERSRASVAPVTSQDINPKDRADLAQGGEIRLDVAEFSTTWNIFSVNGNNDDMAHAMLPATPIWFNIDAKGVATPNPDYLVSATETSQSPTVINFKLNPKAVWGDGSPIDVDDMIATWKACNGEDKKFQCATTQGFDAITDVKAGADKFDATVTFKAAYPDWTSVYGGNPSVFKAESVKDPATFNDGWDEPNNDWLSGPFKVQSFNKTQKLLTLEPNDKWWGAQAAAGQDQPPRDLNRRHSGSIRQQRDRLVRHRSGPGRLQAGFRRSGRDHSQGGRPELPSHHVQQQVQVPLDLAVRQAVVRSLDRTAIGSSDLAGIDWPVAPLNNHVFLTNQEGYDDMAKATGLDYDLEKAKADLDAAGWKVGSDGIREKTARSWRSGSRSLVGVPVSENEALQVQNQLKEAGIKVNIINVPIAKFQDGSAC